MAVVIGAEEISRLERTYPDGVSAAIVVSELRQRGVDLAEATFRKYVQLGLLPRSRRVGRKGKHRGSHGLYPVSCVAQVAEIRRLMDAGLTLEEIQQSALAVTFEVDSFRRVANEIVQKLLEHLPPHQNGKGTLTLRRLQSLRAQAEALASAFEQVANDVCPGESGAPTLVSHGLRPVHAAVAARVSRRKQAVAPPGHHRAGAHR